MKLSVVAVTTLSLVLVGCSMKGKLPDPNAVGFGPGDRSLWTLSTQPKPGTIVKVTALKSGRGSVDVISDYIADTLAVHSGVVPDGDSWTLGDGQGADAAIKFISGRAPAFKAKLDGKRSVSLTLSGASSMTGGNREQLLAHVHALEERKKTPEGGNLFLYLERNPLSDDALGYYIITEVVTARNMEFKSSVKREIGMEASCAVATVTCGSIKIGASSENSGTSNFSNPAVVYVRMKKIGLMGPVVSYSNNSKGPAVAGGAF